MRVKCSWCKKTMVFDDNDDSTISHGICLQCAMKELEEAGVDGSSFLSYYRRRKQPMRIYSDEEES